MTYPTGPDADPYLDPANGVLRNRFGITDAEQLERVEADTAALELLRLRERPVPGRFDLQHLQAIHRRLFGSIYPWAGELRRVEMAKEETRFANADFIAAAADGLFKELHRERLLCGLPDRQYAGRLAYYFSEVNVLHPFREGNGRRQRAFFALLAQEDGRRLAWERLDAERPMSTVQTPIHCPPALRSHWCNEPAVQPCSTRPSPASGAPSPPKSRSRLTSTARACGRPLSGSPERPFEPTFGFTARPDCGNGLGRRQALA
jgi:cell filamentation protein